MVFSLGVLPLDSSRANEEVSVNTARINIQSVIQQADKFCSKYSYTEECFLSTVGSLLVKEDINGIYDKGVKIAKHCQLAYQEVNSRDACYTRELNKIIDTFDTPCRDEVYIDKSACFDKVSSGVVDQLLKEYEKKAPVLEKMSLLGGNIMSIVLTVLPYICMAVVGFFILNFWLKGVFK